MKGLVVKTHNRFYEIKADDDIFLCSPKGSFKRKAEPEYRLPVVGDQVEIELLKERQRGVDGYIVEIDYRRNRLKRALVDKRRERVMAANLDRILIVSACVKPGIDWGFIDRYLLTCALADIPCSILLNKIDLDEQQGEDKFIDIYRALDYPMLKTSVKGNIGLDTLRDWTAEGISLFTGASGVGKSSLINCLAPRANLATGEVDARKGTGKHTTTTSALVRMEAGKGWLADSPGLRDFAPPPVEPDQVRFGYREIAQVQKECRFSTCLHDAEPGCAVREAVAAGTISNHRYRSYLAVFQEMRDYFQTRF
ncbi:ribosome small subunit-dependent GTPase A [Acanthopleuribacter pedis]|uniref:Small ribosomal subunit biogenesis GTPase RsgA n=1 Tax=Acanthopleuribacter pedis TaxID=442870 RepID=A0A8J7QP75_9BACT|nr:ribosome small subunit-dependent GTPase A [Acanthopleuribacter pedis]MBO1321580.1 ribosome small subunit-dependent GTPase A [Acanthopleuribacter pedis]